MNSTSSYSALLTLPLSLRAHFYSLFLFHSLSFLFHGCTSFSYAFADNSTRILLLQFSSLDLTFLFTVVLVFFFFYNFLRISSVQWVVTWFLPPIQLWGCQGSNHKQSSLCCVHRDSRLFHAHRQEFPHILKIPPLGVTLPFPLLECTPLHSGPGLRVSLAWRTPKAAPGLRGPALVRLPVWP